MRRLTYQDESRLEYGRLLWRCAEGRARLIRHWTDSRHPYSERFGERWQPLVERVLEEADDDSQLDASLRAEGLSLRVVVKEIPPVFGSFY
jgi:hypothetical protein